jgi:hypothetical protein
MGEAGAGSAPAMRRNNPETKPTPFGHRDEVVPSSTQVTNRSGRTTKETVMAAIAKAFSSITPVFSADFDSLKTIALFCAAGLFVSLLFASYGLDLSAGFF